METKWIALMFLSPLLGVMVIATAVKWYEVRKAGSWMKTSGRVTRARSVAREVRGVGDADKPEMRNFAEITYEFEVGGRKRRGNRVSIGEDLGNGDVAGTLARYPVGKPVTVYYDPDDPAKCVLERDLPEGIFQVMGGLIAGLSALLLGIVFGIDALAEFVRPMLPTPENTPFVVGFSLFGLVCVLFIFALRSEANAALRWPKTEGMITSSGLATVEKISTSGGAMRRATHHNEYITYAYEVAGVSYQSNKIAFGGETSSTSERLVSGHLAKYPRGKKVTVYYNPTKPSEAVLERRARHLWVLYVAALCFAYGAYAFAQ